MLLKGSHSQFCFPKHYPPRAAIHSFAFLNAIQRQPFTSLAIAGSDGGGIGPDKGGSPGLPAALPPTAPGGCPAHLQTPDHPKVQGELIGLCSKNKSTVLSCCQRQRDLLLLCKPCIWHRLRTVRLLYDPISAFQCTRDAHSEWVSCSLPHSCPCM